MTGLPLWGYGLRLSHPELVDEDAVRVIKDIADELVVHTDAVRKVGSREDRVTNFLADVRLNALYDTVD